MSHKVFDPSIRGGLLLVLATVMALVISHSPLAPHVQTLLAMPLGLAWGGGAWTMSLSHWINDGLMALFFFYVGLEVKREITSGELSQPGAARLPFVAALGGMLGPAVVYLGVASWVAGRWSGVHVNGWPIPTATDIAFTLSVLHMLGRSVPPVLRTFLVTLAIFDDLGAIALIALLFTQDLHGLALLGGGGVLLVLWMCHQRRVVATWPYVVLGALLWGAVLTSGVHATLAGFATAMCVPAASVEGQSSNFISQLEHTLHPWVTYVILPMFALTNAGVSFHGSGWSSVVQPVPIGILAGLVLGKPWGIGLATWCATRGRVERIGPRVTLAHVVGGGCLCGIGFTMSLFIGDLAFAQVSDSLMAQVRAAIMLGSLVSALVGVWVFRRVVGSAD